MIIYMLQDAHVYQKQTLFSKTSITYKMNHLHLKEHEYMLDLIDLNLWRFLLLALRAARASRASMPWIESSQGLARFVSYERLATRLARLVVNSA